MQEIKPFPVRHPVYSHVVHVPRSLNAGKQARKFFRNERDANDYCISIQRSISRVGYGFFSDMSEEERGQVAAYLSNLRKSKMTFREAFERFQEFHQKSSGLRYNGEIRARGKFWVEAFGDRLLIDLSGGEIRDLVLSVEASQTTRHAYFRLIRSILNFAVSSGWMPVNPCSAISRQIEKPDRPKGILSPEDFKRVWAVAEPELRMWLALGAFAGLRPVEAMRLEWQHVDFEANEIYVPAAITKQSKKSYTEGRVVALLEPLKSYLFQKRQTSGGMVNASSSTINRQKWKAEKATESEDGKEAAVDIPSDALRHSFATYLFSLRRDMAYVSAQLGHTGSMVTMRHYARRDISKVQGEAWFALNLCGG